ncbi:hypothetical protein M758_1G103900 [Ceratodon purpureus]|uniref:Secreted protein n=1 Tax=Ceratodon purpureus TaxID=3225 RepID=A0A8T0J716_CERPU|nr:hypothetical protein KC19_1G115100 [Ceratodon purpureus]KAG0629441.1 hypothetical protein M758_1G103900 [Ceratodon purpureus]
MHIVVLLLVLLSPVTISSTVPKRYHELLLLLCQSPQPVDIISGPGSCMLLVSLLEYYNQVQTILVCHICSLGRRPLHSNK